MHKQADLYGTLMHDICSVQIMFICENPRSHSEELIGMIFKTLFKGNLESHLEFAMDCLLIIGEIQVLYCFDLR